jgi:hypothetical protein
MSPTISVDGVTVRTEVVRKRVKNVNARLRGDTLYISAPHHLDDTALAEMIERLARRLLRRRRSHELNAEDRIAQLARRVAARFSPPVAVENVELVTTQRKRWGSYSSRTGTVRLHAALAQMPEWVLEAVVAHELAHVVHPDHSPEFWDLLHEVCPDTPRAQSFLAGVGWLAASWDQLPPLERAILAEMR